jgi:hypothetical protein
MPLSRHYYSLDEVEAALLFSTSRNTPDEALFWAEELILSGYASETISILFQSWLWNTGSMRLQWLIDAYKSLASDELSENDILLATYRLSNIHNMNRDSSLWNILILTIQNPNKIPDTVTRKTPHILPSNDPKEVYFVRAMYQGKTSSSVWISQYIPTDRVWELLDWFAENIYTRYQDEYKICLEALKNYELLLGYKSNEYDIIVRCASIIMMCICPKKQDESFKPQIGEIDKYNTQLLNEWSATVGRRDRRVYQIPNSCLYGTTARGRSKWTQSNLTQLYNIEKHLIGCPFWDEVLEEYARVSEEGEIEWLDDDRMEEFYDKYFPDDIPDEWSKKDKQKSHGDGVLGPTDKPNIAKYSRNFLTKKPHLAWNTNKLINSYLETLDINDCALERIIEYYTPPNALSEEDLKKLEPVHKIKVV